MIKDILLAAAGNLDTPAYRYWRIRVTANQNTGTVYSGFSEIELRSVLGGADVTTTSTPVATLAAISSGAAQNLVKNDGASSGAYGNQSATPQFDVYIDLGSPQVIRQVALMGSTTVPTANGKDFTIQAANTVGNWVVIKTLVNQTSWTAGAFNLYNL